MLQNKCLYNYYPSMLYVSTKIKNGGKNEKSCILAWQTIPDDGEQTIPDDGEREGELSSCCGPYSNSSQLSNFEKLDSWDSGDQDFVGDWGDLSVTVFGQWQDLEPSFFVS